MIAVIVAQVKSSAKIESQKIKALRKLFISTSLSTALISFASTMGGLQLYIFQNNFISAFVLSGAVQGALFGISTEFFGIFSKFSRKISKTAFIIIWILLLSFSSGFSYVGISKTAYPDDVLKADAEQIMLQYCLDTDYELLDYTKKIEKEYLNDIYDYLDTLNGGVSGFIVSQQDKQIFENQKSTLKKYQIINEIDNPDGTKTNASEIKAILDTEMLCIYIDTIKEGNYGNSLGAYKNELASKIKEAADSKNEYDEKYEDENKLIAGDPSSENELAQLGYNGRLAQFRNLSDPNYKKLQQDIATAEANKKIFKALSGQLDDFVKYLEECQRFIENDFETGVENDIYQKTRQLKEEINKEGINTDTVISISEAIYNKLIENNTSADDERIKGYVTFKNNINAYKTVIEQRQCLEEEIKDLNDYSSALLLGATVDLADISADTDEKPSDSSEDATPANHIEDIKLMVPADRSESDKMWEITWSNHLLKIQSVIKELPNEYRKTGNSAIEKYLANTSEDNRAGADSDDVISLPKKKTKYLEEISDIRRLYLLDINDFDRAWTLLFASFHPLKYKLMLFVSIVIAFGLDLISFAMGCLLSKIKEQRM